MPPPTAPSGTGLSRPLAQQNLLGAKGSESGVLRQGKAVPSPLLGSDSTHHHRQLLSGALSHVTLRIANGIGEVTDCTLLVQKPRASLMLSWRGRYWICPWLSLQPRLGQLRQAQLRSTEAWLECGRGGPEIHSPTEEGGLPKAFSHSQERASVYHLHLFIQ